MLTESMYKNGCPWTIHDEALLDALTPEEQEQVIGWIQENLIPASKSARASSYGLKHWMTHDTGIYVTNNQFKHAMQKCGFKPRSTKDLNWVYNLHRRSLVFVHRDAKVLRYALEIPAMTPEDESKKNFYTWMQKKYKGKDTPAGDFAEDMYHDLTWPHEDSREVILRYLSEISACDAAIRVFKNCWKKYVNETT